MLAASYGWRVTFAAVGIASAGCLATLLLLLPSVPGIQSTSMSSFGTLLRKPLLTTVYITVGLSAAGHFAAYTYLQALLIGHARLGTSGVSWALFAYGVAGAVGTVLGERVAALHLERFYLLVVLAMSAAVTIAVSTANALVIVLSATLWGLAFGAMPVCTQLWVFRASPQSFEAASAMSMTVFQTSLALGALTGGIAFDRYGLTAAFAVGAVLLGLCALVIPRMNRTNNTCIST